MYKDLLILAADKCIEFTLQGILGRDKTLGIRKISYDIRVHPKRDPGCRAASPDFLRVFSAQYEHALVIFDKEGCGEESKSRETIEQELETRLAHSGWGENASVIVIEPELEAWVWSPSPEVARQIGWTGQDYHLIRYLRDKGLWDEQLMKPARPKETLEHILRVLSKPRSSALYKKLALNVSFHRCQDGAFIKLCTRLRAWFGE